MLSATIKIVQVMDSWAILATLREDGATLDQHDYASQSTVLPLTDAEDLADALTAVLSVVSRWVAMTSLK
jgi:hypothetical protein